VPRVRNHTETDTFTHNASPTSSARNFTQHSDHTAQIALVIAGRDTKTGGRLGSEQAHKDTIMFERQTII